MNSRYPTFDILHQRNHRYDPATLESEQAWAREVIGAWVASSEDDVATAVAKAHSDADVVGASAILRGNHPVGAKAIIVATLVHSQTNVPSEHIEASLHK